jgi:GNAT superfamily N-acetyltransferase
VKLIDVDRDTEPTFLRCLHDERPDDPRVVRLRRSRFDVHRGLGLRAKVLILDTGEVAGLCQYSPIEHTHIVGRDLLFILCMWVHGYDHHIGNRQGNGYGRFILESIEADARGSGAGGLAAWGMDFPYWNPISFYEHMGYTRVDQSGLAVLAWKPFRDSAEPPRFLRPAPIPGGDSEKVSLTVFLNGWCTGACEQCVTAREAVEGLDDIVDYREVDTSTREALRRWGISDGIYVEGNPYRPYEAPCTSDVLRQDLIALAKQKRSAAGNEQA